MQPEDEFLILACDGIWDVATCENVRDFVTDHLKVGLLLLICSNVRLTLPTNRLESALLTSASAA